MKLQEILEQAVRDEDVSDVFLVAGLPIMASKDRMVWQVRVGSSHS